MQNLLQKFAELWQDWGPWISLMLVPTIITGLSQSPRTEKAAGIAKKVWEGFLQILTFFSITTFKDHPGTFKLPLKSSKSADPGKPKGSSGPGSCAALVLIITLGSTQVMACAWWNSETGKNIRKDAIDCAIESVKANAAHLLPVIMAVVTGDAPNWKEQIEAFTKEFGRDSVACALQMAAINLQSQVPASGTTDDPEAAAAAQALRKSGAYVQSKGWTFKDN